MTSRRIGMISLIAVASLLLLYQMRRESLTVVHSRPVHGIRVVDIQGRNLSRPLTLWQCYSTNEVGSRYTTVPPGSVFHITVAYVEEVGNQSLLIIQRSGASSKQIIERPPGTLQSPKTTIIEPGAPALSDLKLGRCDVLKRSDYEDNSPTDKCKLRSLFVLWLELE